MHIQVLFDFSNESFVVHFQIFEGFLCKLFFLSFLKKTNFLLLRRKCVFSKTITELLNITQPLKTFFKVLDFEITVAVAIDN